jgi:hypothetical protein
MWRGPSSTQRQTQKLILGPTLTTKARLLTFNRTQSRVVIGLLTGHNTLSRHLYLIGLNNNPSCWRCSTEEETSVHILCECEAYVSGRHAYVFLLLLGPRIYRVQVCGPSGTLVKELDFLNLVSDYGAKRVCFKS